jgi:hypothetical protein
MQSSHLTFPMPVHPGAHNQHRPHRALHQRPPLRASPPGDEPPIGEVTELDRVRRRDLLGGLIHEHQLAA